MKWIVRLLGAVVVLIIVAVGVLAAMGMREGANELKSSVEIGRSPSAVWPWITQAERQKQWVGWLVDIRPVGERRDGVGAREIWVMEDKNNNNQLMEIMGELTAVEVNKFVEVKLSSAELFDGTASYKLTDLGDGRTRMETVGKYHFQSAFARLLLPVIMPQARKKMEKDLAKLKELIEAEPAATPGLEQVSAPAK